MTARTGRSRRGYGESVRCSMSDPRRQLGPRLPGPVEVPVGAAQERADDGQDEHDRRRAARKTRFCRRRARGEPDAGRARRGSGRARARRSAEPRRSARQEDAAEERAVDRERADVERRVGDDLLQPEEVPGRLRRVRRDERVGRLLERRAHEDDEDADDARSCRGSTMATRRVRSGTALTVSVRAPRASWRGPAAPCRARRRAACRSSSSTAGRSALLAARSASRSARARPPSLRTRHMWYTKSDAEQRRAGRDVQHVEADQRRLLDRAAADQQLADRRPDERDRGRDVGADGDGPVRELVPRAAGSR